MFLQPTGIGPSQGGLDQASGFPGIGTVIEQYPVHPVIKGGLLFHLLLLHLHEQGDAVVQAEDVPHAKARAGFKGQLHAALRREKRIVRG